MSKVLDEMISSAMEKEQESPEPSPVGKKEEDRTGFWDVKPRPNVSERDQEENLGQLRNYFEHYVGKEACTELEPEFAVYGNDGTILVTAEGHHFEFRVEGLHSKEFREKHHGFYAMTPDGKARLLDTLGFDEELKTKLLAAIGHYLGKEQ